VVMLDMTGSMSDDGMEAAELATIAFMEKIVKNEDGSYNENRIAVYAFNSGDSSPYELVSLKKITSDSELATATTAIKTASDKQASGGTPFDEAASKCKDVLAAAKTDGTGNDRQQFCVFMSDGGPTSYKGSDGYTYYGGNNTSGDRAITSYIGGYTSSSSSSWTYNLPTEYYTDAMKTAKVTVYTVGLLLQNVPSSPSPYSSMTASTYDSTTDTLTTIGSHYYFTSTILKNMASDSSKYIDIFNVDNADKATAAFESIAMSILQAATDITVEDQITDEYTMIFDVPTGSVKIDGEDSDLADQEFYIEFGKYALDENHERTTFTSVTKLYLENTNGTLSAKDSTDPVFEAKTIGDKGTLYYWTTDGRYASEASVTYTNSDATYYFIPYGMKSTDSDYDADVWFNMTSGAYANGTVDSATNMSENLVIATPYFVYNASDKMIYWTVDKLDTYEYTLSYFLYLNDSATEVATSNETDPGPYPTNDHAYITYTNFQGNDCRQVFPIPQLTWNGAQVSYVFYLVNAAGQPINKSGQVVDFANATFITDVYTEAVVWNKAGETSTGTGELSADWLAVSKLPEEYDIYDEQARYVLNVYENADGTAIKNQFTISGDTAANISSSLNTRLNLDTTANTVSVSTTKVYNTKAGEKISAYGTYTSADSNMTGFDFANTTVAFAVVWQPRLVPDVVVVDYGLDVLINVVQNDILQNKVTGIGLGNSAYGNIAMNTGVSTSSKLGTAALTIDGNTISIENETSVRFHQGDMEFNKAVEFYYETPVEFWEGSDPTEGFMYSSVTVIPATTIYYEDEFVTCSGYTWDYTANSWASNDSLWKVEGTTSNSTQAQDRPGDSLIGAIDANNLYGYDGAYADMSTYSNGSAKMVTVDYDNYATAAFTFWGTGFDIISLTSDLTGGITMDVYAGDASSTTLATYTTSDGTTAKHQYAVDTFYGYKYENGQWVVDPSADDALYQVPVMKLTDLTYGQYTVKIKVTHNALFDHGQRPAVDEDDLDSYDFYLDAIRIYDPANDGANDTSGKIAAAYIADGEGWPSYIELRDGLISRDTLGNADTTEVIVGEVFIDGDPTVDDNQISDYISYGPNNEVYLASGQSIAFLVSAPADLDKLNIGISSADGNAGTYTITNIAETANEEKGLDAGDDYNAKTFTVRTTTDMYYDLSDWKDDIIVIKNIGDSGIISLTNIKSTYKSDPAGNVTTIPGTEAQTVALNDSPLLRMAAAPLAVNAEQETTAPTEVVETAEPELTYVYMTAEAAQLVLANLNSSAEEIPDETEPEETEPTVPDETEPEETEPTVPDETEPEVTTPEETEPTVPGETEPGEESDNGRFWEIIGIIIGLIGKIFG